MTRNVDQYVRDLVEYGIHTHLIGEDERIYSTNMILDVMDMDSYEEPEEYDIPDLSDPGDALEKILQGLLSDAAIRGVTEDDHRPPAAAAAWAQRPAPPGTARRRGSAGSRYSADTAARSCPAVRGSRRPAAAAAPPAASDRS